MTEPLILGIDIGTTNCKAILFELDGRMAGLGSAPTPTYHPQPEWTEHDPEQLWLTVAATIQQALGACDPQRVCGVAVTSVGEAGVLIDAAGRALGPMIAWHDSRTTPELRRWQRRVDQRRADAITGLPARPICTLFKLQWLRDHDREAYQRADRWLLAADYIAFRLCGVQATDYSLASRTLMLDLHSRQWSEELIDLAELRHDLMPPLLPAGTALGGVTPEAAAATGLHAGTTVGVGGHDHIAGAFAVGVVRDGQCLDSLGTAEAIFLPLDREPPVDATYHTGCTLGAHVARDQTFLFDGLLSGGAAINWVRDLLTPGSTDFGDLEHLAASAPPGSRGALFLPHLTAGERGGLAGLTLASGRAEIARAVYEGLAFGWRQLLERSETTLGLRVHTISAIGGGVRSAIWVAIKADVLGRPLRIVEQEESVALGAAMLAGIASGAFQGEADALARVRLNERIITPNTDQAAYYDRIYHERFLHLAPALAEIHAATSDHLEN
jgi:xylulokinase